MDQDKINQVLSVLCKSIQSERVFLEFAAILGASTGNAPLTVLQAVGLQSQPIIQQGITTDLDFAQKLIETLTIALAANPLYEDFRAKLRGKKPTQFVASKEVLFYKLYRTWCISPVATLTLCLLSRNYELGYNLIPRFTIVEIDTTKLIQLGNLVQLIESPSFTSNEY